MEIKVRLTRLLLFAFMIFLSASCTILKRSYEQSVSQSAIDRPSDSTVVIKAGKMYEAGRFKRLMLGDHYRDVWTAPVEVFVLDFEKAKGGLEIIDRGGGMQTYSLSLKSSDGRLYSLRSIQKDPAPALPFALRYSFAADLIQDQISASHPYGAFILPPLADAIGIYHTNPQLVYVPDTPELGKYRDDFGGILAMLEEDADEDWTGYQDFGNTENAVSTNTARKNLRYDNDNYVDQKNFLRARLFDMWIGDWDRHDGQFRWAELEWESGKYYRPIPEDRDNIFFKFDGVIPWWASRKWAFRKFQDFKPEVRDLIGLNLSARHMDRRFLSALSQEEWVDIANDMQRKLTNEVIENAVSQLPDTVYQLTGRELMTALKARRENLEKLARKYYHIIAREVDIVGSNDSEYFEVVRRPNGDTEVNVFESDDGGDKKRKFYHRIFHPEETEEIRLYGLGEEDHFYVSGESERAALLRIIGGRDEDTFVDSSRVEGLRRMTMYYDDEKENNLKPGMEAKVVLSHNADNNKYEYEGFDYDYLGPTLSLGGNRDDGIFFGGGAIIEKHGFRKYPYASRQKIATYFAPRLSSVNIEYEGDFINVIGGMGFNIDLSVRAPNYFTNFYGFGNETQPALSEDDEFYKVHYQEVLLNMGAKLRLEDRTYITFGPAYQYAQVEKGQDNFIDLVGSGLNDDIFDPAHFVGFKFEADVRTTEIEHKPEKGIRWLTEVKWLGEINNDFSKFSTLRSDFSIYYTVDIPLETTFAVRLGGASISGDFNFYQANTIGGNSGFLRPGTVRGYSRDRFAGRSSLYQNNEVRMRLLKVPFYYLPFEFGISGHFDQGRVWADGEESDQWHRGVGGGVWITPIGRWVFTATYTKSDGKNLYNLNLGFMF